MIFQNGKTMSQNDQSKIIALIDSNTNINTIKNYHKKHPKLKIITFDFESHNLLTKNEILHDLSDNYIENKDLELIQKNSYHFSKWYEIPNLEKQLSYKGINLGKLFYSEFFIFLLPFLKKFLEIQRICEKYSNHEFIANGLLFEILKKFTKSISFIASKSNLKQEFFSDSFEFQNKLLKIKISKQNYFKVKKLLERITSKLTNPRRNTNFDILLVEFNTALYSNLFQELFNENLHIAYFGLKRPAIWNKNSLSIIRKSKCKVIISQEIFDNLIRTKIEDGIKQTKSKIQSIFRNDEIFESFFSLNKKSFWEVMKPYFLKIHINGIIESIQEIELTYSMLEKYRPKLILVLSESSKTDQIIINQTKQLNIPVMMVQHGLGYDAPEGHQWNEFTGSLPKESMKFIVWGKAMERYAKEYKIPMKKIQNLGSIAHDDVFKKLTSSIPKNEYILLAAEGPRHTHVNDYTVKINEEYEKLIKKICKIIHNRKIKLIIKLHPYEKEKNESKIAKKIDPSIKVLKKGNMVSLVKNCQLLITMSITTAILDAFILGKPVVRIKFREWMGNPDKLREQSSISSTIDDFDTILDKISNDETFKQKIISDGKKFVDDCLSFQGKSAKEIANFLKNFTSKL